MFNYFGFSAKAEPKKDVELDQLLIGLVCLDKSFSAVLNDQVQKAKAKFDNEALSSEKPNPFVKFGKGIFSYQTCLMGLEEGSFAIAAKDLQDAEAAANLWSTQIIAQLKTTTAGTESHKELSKAKLALDIMMADCLSMLSSLSFLAQSISEYARAAYRLKRSYDIYHATNKAALSLFGSSDSFKLSSFQDESQMPLSRSSGGNHFPLNPLITLS